MLNSDFYVSFKRASEEKWRNISIRSSFWGFQIQAGTQWNPGLSEKKIDQYESDVNVSFPSDLRAFLREMNGTDKHAVDVRGDSGEKHRFGQAFYSYPRDLSLIRDLIEIASTDPKQLRQTLAEEGFQLGQDAKLLPIFSHRYVVCSSGVEVSAVLSLWDSTDAIVYGQSLPEYLQREVFGDSHCGD